MRLRRGASSPGSGLSVKATGLSRASCDRTVIKPMSPKMLHCVDLEDGPLVLKGAEETSEECVQALGQLGSSSWTGVPI